MMAGGGTLENAPFFAPVLVEPEAGGCTAADQGTHHGALLAFGYAADHRARARAGADDRGCAHRAGHPTMTVLVIDDARTIKDADPAIADSISILVAPDKPAVPLLRR